MYIRRTLEKKLEKYHKDPEIIAVVGPRQCGKTTMLDNFLANYKNVKKVSFDDYKALSLFEEDIDSFIMQYVNNTDILFIDEIQYSQDSGQKLKYIYDTKRVKIYISGSSATELSLQSIKYLVGRILVFNLYPFSFEEFLYSMDTNLHRIYKKGNYKSVILEQMNKYLNDFLKFGGYPRVALEPDEAKKTEILKNIYNTYFMREIREILQYSKDYKLKTLFKALANQNGDILNYEELANLTGYYFKELKEALNILEKTYICSFLSPFFTNKRTELVKNPKIYFIDHGIKNYILGKFENFSGDDYENLILQEYIKEGKELKFWRSQTKAEVDFIYEKIPIEIKANVSKTTLTKSFFSFLKKYEPKEGYVCSRDFESERVINKTTIKFLPFVKFIEHIKSL